ncbi:hypothetical protein PanWU01x14_204050 [Parasponia andersonii]|uniref:Uncharacterized protein n=1 Tax=Parasponia andersonii TaxID=3476 RepID=A0A2P5BWJ0_PARAD|nr:hypothetical protein PanWU01x14_204050 [Parasponia andersonii]
MTYVKAFLEGQEDEGKDVDTCDLRDNEVIVFGFENGMVTANPIKGKWLARACRDLFSKMKRVFVEIIQMSLSPTPVPDQQHGEVGGGEHVV